MIKYQIMKKISIALFLFSILITDLPAQTYEEMVNRSMDYVEQNDYAAAEQALKAALRKEPTNPSNTMLMVNLGTIQRNLGKFEEALLSYNVALEKHPKNSFVRHNRAALYCQMNRFDDALKDYNTILLYDDRDIEALYRRGLIFLSNKDLFRAEESFEKIVEFAPENLYGKMGLAAIMKRRGEWKEAEEAYSDIVYKYKSNGEVYFNRAECYIRLNRLAREQEDITKAISLGYEDAAIYILRGQIRIAQFEKRLAKDDFLKAKELGAEETVVNDFLLLCK